MQETVENCLYIYIHILLILFVGCYDGDLCKQLEETHRFPNDICITPFVIVIMYSESGVSLALFSL